MSLLSDAKLAVRISGTDFDDEISGLIAAAIEDMESSGVTSEATGSETPLVRTAIINYVKANFGWDNPESERFMRAYESIRNKLSMTVEQGYYSVTFHVLSGSTDIRQATVTFDGETKQTGADGTAKFYKRPGTNYAYSVGADGYSADNDALNRIDVVNSSVSVQISLTAV